MRFDFHTHSIFVISPLSQSRTASSLTHKSWSLSGTLSSLCIHSSWAPVVNLRSHRPWFSVHHWASQSLESDWRSCYRILWSSYPFLRYHRWTVWSWTRRYWSWSDTLRWTWTRLSWDHFPTDWSPQPWLWDCCWASRFPGTSGPAGSRTQLSFDWTLSSPGSVFWLEIHSLRSYSGNQSQLWTPHSWVLAGSLLAPGLQLDTWLRWHYTHQLFFWGFRSIFQSIDQVT